MTDYVVVGTAAGWAVERPDGGRAEFLDRADAEEALASLTSGEGRESDYEWREASP